MTQHNNNTPFISKRPRHNKKQQEKTLDLMDKILLSFFTVYFGGHVLLWATINLFKG